jgi:hypothetical protein
MLNSFSSKTARHIKLNFILQILWAMAKRWLERNSGIPNI